MIRVTFTVTELVGLSAAHIKQLVVSFMCFMILYINCFT